MDFHSNFSEHFWQYVEGIVIAVEQAGKLAAATLRKAEKLPYSVRL